MSPRPSKLPGSPLKKATGREVTAGVFCHATPSPRKPSLKEVSPKKRPLEEDGGGVQPVSKKLCSESATATSEVNTFLANVEPIEKDAPAQDTDEVCI